jgi:hypothetical protein
VAVHVAQQVFNPLSDRPLMKWRGVEEEVIVDDLQDVVFPWRIVYDRWMKAYRLR